MNNPHLTIYVNNVPELVIEERKDDRCMQQIRHTLESLNVMDTDRAHKTVGSDIMGLMAYWYSNEFYPFRNLRYERKFEEELNTINMLVNRSLKNKTNVHVATIQALVDEILSEAPDMNRSKAIENWKAFRERIESVAR